MAFYHTIKTGISYLQDWPEHPILNAIFKEGRVRSWLKLGNVLIPPFIFFILLWNFIQGGGLKGVDFLYTQKINWPVTAVCIIFLLMLPLHAYYWAGKRAQTKLNPTQRVFYADLCEKLEKAQAADPTMHDLARAIGEGLKKLGPDFLDRL